MQITGGKIKSAQKVVIYGPEGVGKTVFASCFPAPVFIDTEGGTRSYDVNRLPNPDTFEMVMEEVRYITHNPQACKTLVLDTADWAERLCVQNILAKFNRNGIEEFGYGKGYVYLNEAFGKLLNALEDVVRCGVNVVVCAHAQLRKFEQPDEFGAYDRWELKLMKQNAPMLKEWADMVLFANYETMVVKDSNGKAKAQGNKRVMYATHNPCWDAKNRVGLPDKMDFNYSEIARVFEEDLKNVVLEIEVLNPKEGAPAPTPAQKQTDDELPFTFDEDVRQTELKEPVEPDYILKLRALMAARKVTDDEIIKVVADRGYFPPDMTLAEYPRDFVEGVLIGAWEKMFEKIEELRDSAF